MGYPPTLLPRFSFLVSRQFSPPKARCIEGGKVGLSVKLTRNGDHSTIFYAII